MAEMANHCSMRTQIALANRSEIIWTIDALERGKAAGLQGLLQNFSLQYLKFIQKASKEEGDLRALRYCKGSS